MPRPVIVYVSGAPGSGKTTLARLISEQLYVPSISSDLIHGGIALTNPDHDRKQTLQNVFVPVMVDIAKRDISFVVDHVLQKGISEKDIIDKLRPHAAIINIHTTCANPVERYVNRVENSELPSVIQRRQHLLSLAAPHSQNLPNTSMPLELGVALMVVKADDGYDPKLSEIVSFIRNNFRN